MLVILIQTHSFHCVFSWVWGREDGTAIGDGTVITGDLQISLRHIYLSHSSYIRQYQP